MNFIHVNLSKKFRGGEQVYLDLSEVLNKYQCQFQPIYLLKKKGVLQQKVNGELRFFFKGGTGWSKYVNKLRHYKSFSNENVFIIHSSPWIKNIKNCIHNPKILAVSHNYSIKHKIHANYIVTVNEHMQNFFIDKGFDKSKIFTIHPTVKPGVLIRKSIDEKFVIGAMGHLSQEKGFDKLIQALSLFPNKEKGIKLVLAGDGPERESLKALASKLDVDKYIEWLGWVDQERANQFWNSIDLLSVPSHKESFGLVILEAMSRGGSRYSIRFARSEHYYN